MSTKPTRFALAVSLGSWKYQALLEKYGVLFGIQYMLTSSKNQMAQQKI